MMNRQEDFKNKRNRYTESFCYENEITSNEMIDAIDETFDNAAEYGYQYAVKKIFKCIEDRAIFGWIEDIEVEKFLEKIRKAMEE